MEFVPSSVSLNNSAIYKLMHFNTVTYAVDHKIGRSQDTRLQSAWYGSGSELKQNALKLAVEMAEAA